MQIINLKRTIYLPSEYEYIGRKNRTYNLRQSKWANPFPITEEVSREKSLELYEEYIRNTPALWDALEELEGKILACWCFPKKCHGDILIELIGEKKFTNTFI